MDSPPSLKKYIVYSICFHAALFILLFILAEHQPVRPVPITKITMLNITPRLGTPTGAIEEPPGLPPIPKKPPQLEKPKPKVEPVKEPEKPKAKPPAKEPTLKVRVGKPKEPVVQKPKTPKVKAPDESEINKALSRIETELDERERQLKEPSLPPGVQPTTTTGKPAFGSPTGSVTAVDPAYARYKSSVRSKIIRNWVKTHTGDQTRKLSARVRVQINASGVVISKSLVRRSGDASFDNSALRAVERASPFPPPPPGVKAEALREGFIVDFRSRVIGRS